MRIALCSESFPPTISGVAVFTSRTAVELTKLGHSVIVLVPSVKGVPGRETFEGVPVFRIRSVPNPFRRKLRLVVGQQRAVSRILKAFQPDLIHVQDPGGCSAAALRWGRRRHIPVVGTRHFMANMIMPYIPLGKMLPADTLYNLVESYAQDFYRFCTVVTCPSQTVYDALKEQCFRGHLEVVSNGVDILPLPPQNTRSHNKVPIVLTVSRIDSEKNIPLLLKAAPEVAAKQSVQFVIVGDGNMLRAYKQYVKRHDLEGIITFTGALRAGSEELLDWYKRANVLVFPSLVETQGIVVLEAMAQALPVIAMRAGALPELVRKDTTGYLVAVPTANHVAATICRALNNPAEATTRGMAGRKMVEAEHARNITVAKLLTVYEKALKGEYSR